MSDSRPRTAHGGARRPVLVLALCIGVLAGLASAAFGPRYGGRLTIGLVGSWPAPRVSTLNTASERLAHGLAHETLVSVQPWGLTGPGLASTIAADPGGQGFVLSLPGDARFHDGTPLTALDVVRSLRRFLRATDSSAAAVLADALVGGQAFRAGRSTDLPGLEAVDAHSVRLAFESPRAVGLLPLAAPAAAITSASGVGCGPFVPVSQASGQVVFRAFEAHAQGRPLLDEITLASYPSRAALDAAFASGRIDALLDTTPQAADPPTAVLLLVLDARRAPFERRETRLALASHLQAHRTALARLVGGLPASGLLPPALHWQPFEIATSPTAPSALTGRVRLAVAREVPALASQHVAAVLTEAGLVVEVQPSDGHNARTTPAEARLLLFVPEVAEAGLALEELAAVGPPDPDVTAALHAAHRERNPDARRALLLRSEGALRSAQVYLPLVTLATRLAVRPHVFDARVDPAGYARLADAWRLP